MEVSGRKIDISAGVPCDLCLLLGKNEKAEHFCADCNEFFCDNCCMIHKVTRYTRNHKLLDSGNMPKQKLESSEDSVCSKHSGEGLKYFCEDHNTIFCSVCVTFDHRNCNLLFIDEIATDFDKTPEYKSLTDSIASFTKQLQKMKEMSIKKGYDLKKSHVKFITDVKAFREEINQILDTIEDAIIKESDVLKEDHLKLAVSASTICDNILAELNMTSEKMREQLRYMQHRQLFMSAKETQIKVKEYQSKLVEMSQGKSMELEFVPNEKLLQSLRSFTTMGDIKQNRNQPEQEDDPLAKLKSQKLVSCRICKGCHSITKCPYKDTLGPLQETLEGDKKPEGDTLSAQPASAAAPSAKGGTKYVPPSMRDGAGKGRGRGEVMKSNRDKLATIRVTNLSEDTRESDLLELFRPFGPIQTLYIAKDKNTGQSKGFAFIQFYRSIDAARAIAGVSGFGYDHLILNVEWA